MWISNDDLPPFATHRVEKVAEQIGVPHGLLVEWLQGRYSYGNKSQYG